MDEICQLFNRDYDQYQKIDRKQFESQSLDVNLQEYNFQVDIFTPVTTHYNKQLKKKILDRQIKENFTQFADPTNKRGIKFLMFKKLKLLNQKSSAENNKKINIIDDKFKLKIESEGSLQAVISNQILCKSLKQTLKKWKESNNQKRKG